MQHPPPAERAPQTPALLAKGGDLAAGAEPFARVLREIEDAILVVRGNNPVQLDPSLRVGGRVSRELSKV
eukprot:3085487-Lingulodinium_polyedra.AAC.1